MTDFLSFFLGHLWPFETPEHEHVEDKKKLEAPTCIDGRELEMRIDATEIVA